MARLGKTQRQQRQLSRWAEELRSRGFKLPVRTSMPYIDLPDEGFLHQLCFEFPPSEDYYSYGEVQENMFITPELIELWRYALIGIFTGRIIPRYMEHDEQYSYQIDETHRINSTDNTAALRPSPTMANRVIQFLNQPYTRKQADKLLIDISPKNVSFPNAKFMRHGDYVIALNQPARLELGIRFKHCLGRVTGEDPDEQSVAILLPNNCIYYHNFDGDYVEINGPRNRPCTISDWERSQLAAIAKGHLKYVSREKQELTADMHVYLMLADDLYVIQEYHKWAKRGISSTHTADSISEIYYNLIEELVTELKEEGINARAINYGRIAISQIDMGQSKLDVTLSIKGLSPEPIFMLHAIDFYGKAILVEMSPPYSKLQVLILNEGIDQLDEAKILITKVLRVIQSVMRPQEIRTKTKEGRKGKYLWKSRNNPEISSNPSRFRREKGVDFDPYVLFNLEMAAFKTITVPGIGDIPRYYFHMHNVEKVGIHPRASYGDTPLGVYAYPLNEEYRDKLINNSLPYQSGATNITILELVDPEHCLVVDGFGEKTKANTSLYNNIKQLLPDAANATRANRLRNHFFGRGYTSIYSTEGTIHQSEPQQIVFLSSSAYRIVYSNSSSAVKRFYRMNLDVIDTGKIDYNKARYGIPLKVWQTELRLWAVDCAEENTPGWEKWAADNMPEHVSVVKETLEVAKSYAYGQLTRAALEEQKPIIYEIHGKLQNMYSNSKSGEVKFREIVAANQIVMAAYTTVDDPTLVSIYLPHDPKDERWWERALALRLKNVIAKSS